MRRPGLGTGEKHGGEEESIFHSLFLFFSSFLLFTLPFLVMLGQGAWQSCPLAHSLPLSPTLGLKLPVMHRKLPKYF